MLGKKHDKTVIYDEDLEELSQGDWEGQLRTEIYTPRQLQKINSNNYTFKAPNGESQEEVENRMFDFIQKMYYKVLPPEF